MQKPASIQVSIPEYYFIWAEFDFPDITVDAGETYYLVCYSNKSPNHRMYVWGTKNSNSYPHGLVFILEEDNPNWKQRPDEDLCFKTYGLVNDPPDPPSITGPLKGPPEVSYDYTFTAIEPEGEDIKYVIDWDDGNSNETDYVASGESITLSHTWSSTGRYTIKAKAIDVLDKQSEWGTLDIQMPLSYNYLGWQWLEDNFPVPTRLLKLFF